MQCVQGKRDCFERRTALVTGAASGVGRAIATRLADDGAHVLAVDLDTEGTGALVEHIGGEALTADLCDPAAIGALELPRRPVDILVNCAGIQHVAPVVDLDPAQFERIQGSSSEA